MAIGYTGSDGNIQEFQYTPVDPTEDLMRQAFERSQQTPAPPQPQGPTPYWENPATYYPRQKMPDPIEQQKAATAAAYKYIAFRGYQNDLKEGKSAADAFAKWGPMLVQDVSFAPAMKALTPTPTGRWVAPNPSVQQPGYYEGQGPSGTRAYFPPESSVIRPDVNAEANVRLIGNRKVYVNPRTGSMTFLDEKPNEWDKIDYTTAAAIAKDAATTLSNPNIMTDEKAAAEKRLKEATDRQAEIRGSKSSTAEITPTPTSKVAPKAGEIRKGYTFKGGNPALADNWEKVL